MQHNNEMVSAKTLLKEVWGYNDNDDEGDTIRVHIRHLRSKLDKISTEKKINTLKLYMAEDTD